MLKPATVLAFLALQLSAPLGGLGAQAVHPTPEAADSAVLASLRASGADLSKPTEHLFYLYFPTKDGARASATDIAAGQAVHKVTFEKSELDPPGDERREWMLRLTMTMVPDLAVIKGLGTWLTTVAEQHKGAYDGWEAAVTK